MMLYADPGSGALVWQLLLALFFGATFYFSRLKSWLSAKLKNRSEGAAETDAAYAANPLAPKTEGE